MKKIWSPIPPVQLALGGLIYFGVLATGLVVGAPWPSESSEFAAWLQAGGAVAALFIAVGVPVWQAEHAKRVRAEESQARTAVARRMAEVVIGTIHDAAIAFTPEQGKRMPPASPYIRTFERTATNLNSFPTHQLHPDAALTFMHLQFNLTLAEETLRQKEPKTAEDFEGIANNLRIIAAEIAERLDDIYD